MRALLLAALLVAGCADDPADSITIKGVDPVETDGDLAPDASLQPEGTDLAPEDDTTPDATLQPEAGLQPDSTL